MKVVAATGVALIREHSSSKAAAEEHSQQEQQDSTIMLCWKVQGLEGLRQVPCCVGRCLTTCAGGYTSKAALGALGCLCYGA